MSYIYRTIEPHILGYLTQARPPYNVVLLSGPRQSGKSTLLKTIFPAQNHLHINLALEGGFCEAVDATSHFEEFTVLLETRFGFKVGGDRVLVIDEAQLSKKLGQYVRFMKEVWKTQKVVLTGSTLSTLFDNHEKPTGRVIEFTLRPFNFQEFLRARQKDTLLQAIRKWEPGRAHAPMIHHEIMKQWSDYLMTGGLPEVVLAFHEKSDYQILLSNLYAFYKRDFSAAIDERWTDLFQQCFTRIAAATGAPILLSSIVKSSSPGYKKLPDVLSLLESWHLILKLPMEASELTKTGTLTPKRYIFDHGIRSHQFPIRWSPLDWMNPQSVRRQDLGGLVEAFIMTELVSANLQPHGWKKDNQSGEVDFVFTKASKVQAIEVKSAVKLNQKHLSALAQFRRFFPDSELFLTNLSSGEPSKDTALPVTILPVYQVFEWFK